MSDTVTAVAQPCSCGELTIVGKEVQVKQGVIHSTVNPCARIQLADPLEFTTYVRKPFVVQAVEVTRENIDKIAEDVGDIRYKEDGTPYILVDRRLVPNVFKVYLGFFMTKMGENVRCYSRKIFNEQFMVLDDTVQPWLDFLDKESGGSST